MDWNKDRIGTLGAGREERDRGLDQFLDAADIFDRLRRKRSPGAGAGRRVFPSLDCLVNRRDSGLRRLACRQSADALAVEMIADADLDLRETVKNIELRQSNPIYARGFYRLAHEHRVEPAATPAPPRVGPEFMPPVAHPLANGIVELGRERPAADPRRVGLGDSQHIADGLWAKARPRGGIGGDRIRRGHKGVSAMIDIEHRALRAFEQNAFARAPGGLQQLPGRIHEGKNFGRDAIEFGADGLCRYGFEPKPAA